MKLVDSSPSTGPDGDHQREALLRSLENAYRLLDSPAGQAFDLSLEPEENDAQVESFLYLAKHRGLKVDVVQALRR